MSDKTLYAHWTYSPPYVPTKHYVCQNYAINKSTDYTSSGMSNGKAEYLYYWYGPFNFPSGNRTYYIEGTLAGSGSRTTGLRAVSAPVAGNSGLQLKSFSSSELASGTYTTNSVNLGGYSYVQHQVRAGIGTDYKYYSSLTIYYYE